MTAAAMLAFWLQGEPDVRGVSWWLPHNPALRDTLWTAVVALNLLALVWILYKLLFAGKGFSIPKMLRERGETIGAQMREADESHRKAEARLAEIEARVANLPAEVAALEREGQVEAAREYERLLGESRRDAERIQRLATQEIEAAAKLAQKELQSLAASLAVELAGQRIREQLSPEQDEAVVQHALEGLRLRRVN